MKIAFNIIKRYKFFLIMFFILIFLFLFKNEVAITSIKSIKSNIFQMLSVLPPIMLLLGLIDVWIPKESLMKFMGDKSGIIGILLAMLLGSFAAGPMYACFPFTTVLIKKGVKFSNIIIFMNTWCLAKISTLLFEISALGYKFTLIRLLIDIPGILFMSYLVNFFMDKNSLNKLYSD